MRTLNVRRNELDLFGKNLWSRNLWNDGFWNLFDNDGYELSNVKSAGTQGFPRCDIHETEQGFLMSFDLPGVKKEDLTVEVKDGVLTLTGERKNDRTRDVSRANPRDGEYGVYSEKYYGKFQRAFTLPETVDGEKIEAHFENGVLQFAIPKAEAKKGKKIEIGHGSETPGLFSRLIQSVKSESSAA